MKQDNTEPVQTPLVQISLCVVSDSMSAVQDLLANAASFFGRYKIPWQLSVVCSSQTSYQEFSKAKLSSHICLAVLPNASRAQKSWLSLTQANGKYKVMMDENLAVPLADILKLCQILMEDPHLSVVFADRFGMPRSSIRNQSGKKIDRERLITNIRREKKLSKLSDSLTNCLVIKGDIFDSKKNLKFKTWYLSPELEAVCQAQQIHYAEAPVHCHYNTEDIPTFATIRLFWFNFF